jgi:hypothetical protein
VHEKYQEIAAQTRCSWEPPVFAERHCRCSGPLGNQAPDLDTVGQSLCCVVISSVFGWRLGDCVSGS